jgi:hypothetical protein
MLNKLGLLSPAMSMAEAVDMTPDGANLRRQTRSQHNSAKKRVKLSLIEHTGATTNDLNNL